MPANYFSGVKPVPIFRALIPCRTWLARVLTDAVLVVVVTACLSVSTSAFVARWAELTCRPRHHRAHSTANFALVPVIAVEHGHTDWVGQLLVESIFVV